MKDARLFFLHYRCVGTKNVAALFVALIAILVFFRQQFLSQFGYLSGDRFDGVIEVALLEHWFNVLKGVSVWSSPSYFFSYEKTLTYNDGYFLYGLVYSVFRCFSFDPFVSSELVNIVFKLIGFFGFLEASRRILNLSFGWALLGAAIFTLSNCSFVRGVHAQLYSVSLAPIEALLVFKLYKAFVASSRLQQLMWGGFSIALFSAWMMTSIYMAWFFAFFALVVLIIHLAIGGMSGIKRLIRTIAENKISIISLLTMTAVSLMPFVDVYVLGQIGEKRRSWKEVASSIPSIFDSINVGSYNLLFGGVISSAQKWCPICDIGDPGRDIGFAPIMFLLAGFVIAEIIGRKSLRAPEKNYFLYVIASACLVAWLLSIKFGSYSGWKIIYRSLPGASGLRVVSRFYLFLPVPAIGLVMWWLSRASQGWPQPIVVVLCGLLIVEEINLSPTAALDRYAEMKRTMSAPKPPAECRSFFTTATIDQSLMPSSFNVGHLYPHNVDAMLIAELLNLPTINGFASFNPPDWDFGYPSKSDYEARIANYAKRHNVIGLCRLNLTTMRWDSHWEDGQPAL